MVLINFEKVFAAQPFCGNPFSTKKKKILFQDSLRNKKFKRTGFI